MFKNLEAEMVRNGISKEMIAEKLSISRKGLYLKLSGKTDFTLTEIKKIQELMPQFTLEYLFVCDTEPKVS